MENVKTMNNAEKLTFDIQSRGWVFTVNNPKQTEKEFFDYLVKNTKNVQFFAFGRERGDGTEENPDGTEHFQGYIEFEKPRRFSTMLNLLSTENIGVAAHIEKRLGKKKDCYDYIMKQGKYKDKAHTRLGEVLTYGELNFNEETSTSKDLKQIIELINDGSDLDEIIANFPLVYMRNYRHIEQFYQAIQRINNEGKRRELEVVYISGAAGIGKTRYVMDKYGDINVFNMTRYGMGMEMEKFDGYNGQKIILFDEFRSSINISNMLRYIDRYYCPLPARNQDKVACYDTVYICSNLPLSKQYVDVQAYDNRTYEAFLRRINKVYNFDLSKEIEVYKDDEEKLKIQQHEFQVVENVVLPFGGAK